MQESFVQKLINDLNQDRELWGDSANWANWTSMLPLHNKPDGKRQKRSLVRCSPGKCLAEMNTEIEI